MQRGAQQTSAAMYLKIENGRIGQSVRQRCPCAAAVSGAPHAYVRADVNVGGRIPIYHNRVVLYVQQIGHAASRRAAACLPEHSVKVPDMAIVSASAERDVDRIECRIR